jgi:chromosome segregation ATPase
MGENTATEMRHKLDKNYKPKPSRTSENMGSVPPGVEVLRGRIKQLEDTVDRLSESLKRGKADNEKLLTRLSTSEDKSNDLKKAVMGYQRRAEETEAAHKAFRGSNKELLKQLWGNTKNFAKKKYEADPDLYNQLAFIGGGALGGAGLGALVSGKGNRLLGGGLGLLAGGGAGALAHYLAKKYKYIS